MNRWQKLLRALAILPASGAGGLIGVVIGGEGPDETGALIALYFFLLLFLACTAIALIALRRRERGSSVWGLSPGAWTVLIAAAFFLGLYLSLVEDVRPPAGR
jgi:uncharacterized membrane protein YfcA